MCGMDELKQLMREAERAIDVEDRQAVRDLLIEALTELGVVIIYLDDLDARREEAAEADAVLP